MFLEKILTRKKIEVERLRETLEVSHALREIATAPGTRDFCGEVSREKRVNIIAEIKKASPSKGQLAKDLDVVSRARIYEQNGASAISVLTDEKFFEGSLDDLRRIKATVSIPVLRKDFILDPVQVYESRLAGADAILLIAAILEYRELEYLFKLATDLGLGVLVEVHDLAELKKVLPLKPRVIGINNRDLKTFRVNISNTLMLLPVIPEEIGVVSESGISSKQDINVLRAAGISAFLIGEALVKARDPGKKLASLIN